MATPRFTLHRGVYRFYLDGRMIYETKEVAVVICKTTGVTHKHGAPDLVKPHFTALRAVFPDDIVMVRSSSWPVEELENLVSISDYGLTLLKKVGDMGVRGVDPSQGDPQD
jgi:hypothetical protein